jgi:hypothetical protein
MTRFADTHTALSDAARLRAQRDAEQAAFEAPFKRIQAKARANAAAFTAKRTWAYA